MTDIDIAVSDISLSDLNQSLLDDLVADQRSSADDISAYRWDEIGDDGYRTRRGIHIVWCEDIRRAGLVWVGSGSCGHTAWTNADSPEDAVRRYLTDAMDT